MNRLHNLPRSLADSFEKRSLLKVIAGLNNFDADSVERITRAASIGGANLVDIACDPVLVRSVREVSGIPICVSAVDPDLFPQAVEAGASIVEIGNYDCFYPQGRIFDREEVFALTVKTRNLLPDVILSVTVPHILPLDQQAQLALQLVDLDVDIIQTEGGTSANPLSPGTLGLVEKAAPTLAATYSIQECLHKANYDIPIICASGLSSVTVPMAIAAGASGVGGGSAVNRLNDELAMVASVCSLVESLKNRNNLTLKYT